MSAEQTISPALFFLGASHRTTPIEMRERIAVTAEKLPTLVEQLGQIAGLREHLIVNICNRVEFYGVCENTLALAQLEAAFCTAQGLRPEEFARIRQTELGARAIEHLLHVASGLESQMLGETEILGQLKDSYAAAQTRKNTGPVLNRVFQKTFQHAKYVRTHTAITEGQISVSNVAVDLAEKIFGALERCRVLLIGAGEIGEKAAKAFQSRGAKNLTVASRRLGRAMELAQNLSAVALPFDQCLGRLSEADIVVCSTSAPGFVIDRASTLAAMKKRPTEPLFFIDLALPRDVETSVADIDNVFLYNLDDLAKIAEENLAAREAEVAHAKKLISEKCAALWKQIEAQVPGCSA